MTVLLDWLQAAGTALLHPVWLPMAAWTVFALTVLGLLKTRSTLHARIQHDARTALLLALPLGLLAAALTDFHLPITWQPAPEVLPPLVEAPPASFPADIPQLETVALPTWTTGHSLGLLAGVALLLAAIRLLLFILDARALRHYLHALQPFTVPELTGFIHEHAARLGLRRSIRVLVAEDVSVPLTYGWIRPTIVLPATVLDDDEHVRLTLLHELIHIRRHDYLWQGVVRLVETVFAIHPLIWYLRRSLVYYREAACDAEVLAQPAVNTKRYATLLYQFARPASQRRFALRMSATDQELKKRILAMKALNRTAHRRWSPSRSLLLSLCVLGAATFFVACADFVSPNLRETDREDFGTDEVFVVVEEMPELVGGLQALQDAIEYPDIARKAGLEGRVIVQFIVDPSGKVVDPEVVRGLGGGLDEEALRVVQQATFEPGRQRGQAVPVKMSVPLVFSLDGSYDVSEGAGKVIMEMPQMRGMPRQAPDGTYIVAEEMPRLEGGLQAVQSEIVYPAVARKAGIEGRVIVQFVVDESGTVMQPVVVRGQGAGLDEEALRVVQNARFTPGQVGGQPVPVKMSIPVTFRLDGDSSGDAGVLTPVRAGTPQIKITELQRTDTHVRGRVIDATTDEPLAGATVIVPDSRIGAATDREGHFRINQVPADATNFKAMFVGYEEKNFTIGLVSFNKTIQVQVDNENTVLVEGRSVPPSDLARTIDALSNGEPVHVEVRIQDVTSDFIDKRLQPEFKNAQSVVKITYRSQPANGSSSNTLPAESLPGDANVRIEPFQLASSQTGNVRVSADGIVLKEGTDYTIDYAAGTVAITNPAYLSRTRKVNISYAEVEHPGAADQAIRQMPSKEINVFIENESSMTVNGRPVTLANLRQKIDSEANGSRAHILC